MKKKLILSITTILILMNALLLNYMPVSYATSTTKPTVSQEYQNIVAESNKDSATDVNKHQTAVNKDKDGTITSLGTWNQGEAANWGSVIVKVLIKMFCTIPYTFQFMLTLVTVPENEDIVGANAIENASFVKWIDDSKINWFTIQDAVFGKVPLFNVDFFDVTTDGSTPNSKLKSSVVSWYQTCLAIAQVCSIVTLIYIGIRMAMATNPQDKVNYKKMLKNWSVGFAMLFILHYGIVIILKIVNWLVYLVAQVKVDQNFEANIINSSINIFDEKVSAWTTLLYAITYVIIVGYQIYFFIKYFKRLLTMGFLVMIAPLITVTYAIDKAGDGKAQAYETWKKMFISNAFMQPVHAFVYVIFMYSASAIATKAPMIAIVFFMGILKAEDVFNKLFKLEKTN